MRRGQELAHGVSARESAILDLFEDEHRAPEVIATTLGIKLTYVRQVISMYRIDGSEERSRMAAAQSSNTAMVQAIAASGGQFR